MFNKLFVIIVSAIMIFTVSCKKDPTSSIDPTTVTDIEGNVYNTVTIGEQVWMVENLKVTHYRNGDAIPNVTNKSDWSNLSTGAYCSYDNGGVDINVYGLLYNWYAVNDNRNIAPEGWHIPSDAEWKELEMYLGMSQTEADDTGYRGTDEGGKLKETGTAHWKNPNEGATNSSGFSGLPGGYRDGSGTFNNVSYYGRWWSSTVTIYFNFFAWYRSLHYYDSAVGRNGYFKQGGFSVRCIQD